jgi:hypothetical protein
MVKPEFRTRTKLGSPDNNLTQNEHGSNWSSVVLVQTRPSTTETHTSIRIEQPNPLTIGYQHHSKHKNNTNGQHLEAFSNPTSLVPVGTSVPRSKTTTHKNQTSQHQVTQQADQQEIKQQS